MCTEQGLSELDPPFSLQDYNFTHIPDVNHTVESVSWPAELAACADNDLLVNMSWAGLCEIWGGEFTRPLVHFDNVPYAYLALFQVATFEGWMEVMEAAIDAPIIVSSFTDLIIFD